MSIKLDSGFEILRFSDVAFEKITVEIKFHGEHIAQLSMDQGLKNAELEVFTEFANKNFVPRFRLSEFTNALGVARNVLAEYSGANDEKDG